MRWRLRNQVLVPCLLLLLGVVSLSVWMALSAANHAREQIETRVRNVARLLAVESTYPLSRSVLFKMKRLSGADFLHVPLEGAPSTTLETLPPDPPTDEVHTDWQKLELGPTFVVDQREYLCSGIRLVRPPRTRAILYILYPKSLLQDAIWDAMRPVLIVGSTVGLASLLLTISLGQRLSRRIQELERRTRLIAAGDFSPMPLPTRNDEIRDLAMSVNEMADQLAQLHEATRRDERLRLLGQVSGGLAHQLRNGLTGARLAVQLFLQQCPESLDVEALNKALSQLALQETHLQRFLHLGRQPSTQLKECSLSGMLHEVIHLMSAQCQHEQISLDVSLPDDPLFVLGDEGQLRELFVNIIGNAIEATGLGGRVEVGATLRGNSVHVEVRDSGSGPPEDIADRLFEPFVTDKPEGVGLGLAVAAQTVELHGGKIDWHQEEGGTCFVIELPSLVGRSEDRTDT